MHSFDSAKRLLILSASLIWSLAASGSTFPLTVDSIMRGPALVGYPPTALRWSGDSADLFFELRARDADEPATWVVSRQCLAPPGSRNDQGAGGACTPRKLTDDERKLAPPPAGVWDRARRRVLAVDAGDIVLIDSVARTRRNITRTTAAEANPRWARDEQAATFTRDNALYLVPLGAEGGELRQLIEAGPPRRDPPTSDSQTFLKEEQRKLLEAVRERAEREKKAEAKRDREALPKLDLTERQTAPDLALAHQERFVYALVVERPASARRADVPNYVTTSAYTEDAPTRIKVGDAQETRRLAIIDLQTKKTVWATLDSPVQSAPEPTTEPKEVRKDAPKQASGPRVDADARLADPQARQENERRQQPSEAGQPETKQPETKQPENKPTGRELRWNMPVVSRDGAIAVASLRSADNEDRWYVTIDPSTGKARVFDHLHDEAWVREPGTGESTRTAGGFLPDDRSFWFLSERDGWMHLYTVDAAQPGATPTQLTIGAWEVTAAALSPDERTFFLTTTEAHSGERHVYTMPVGGGPRARLTQLAGSWSAEASPDGQTLGVIHSSSRRPPEVFLMPSGAGSSATQVTVSPTTEWLGHPWVDPQLVTFDARDGVKVPARLYTPAMVGAKPHPSRPGVVFVHGAGYLQNAHRYWSTYYREYMFHHLLASRGYVVLDVDYRGSAGYGRDWRTTIFRHMGGKDLDDVVDGAAYLAKAHRVDPKRVGVYGGSYGGFITLMAMFTSPRTFAAGAALRPVTDWAHYSHPYTSNILNEPQSDAEAYRRSSPIYFAQNLEGALLICHGMVDVNVHVQDSIRLAQRLIELRKENWELALYPVEDHAFEKETSWADEYKRILKLFEEHLK